MGQISAARHSLEYDTLPPRSRLRREVNADGSISIIAPVGEPGQLARREAMFASAWASSIGCVIFTTLIVAVILPAIYWYVKRSRYLFPIFLIAIGAFFSALFLLVWTVELRRRMEELDRAAAQLTGVRVAPQTLHIETDGPHGNISRTIRYPFRIRLTRVDASPLSGLAIDERNADSILIFAGLSKAELRWVAREIAQASARQPPPTNVTIST